MLTSKTSETKEETLVLNEPAVNYEIKSNINKKEDLLNRLLAIGMKQCEDGLLIPHSQVMAEIKSKYNIS